MTVNPKINVTCWNFLYHRSALGAACVMCLTGVVAAGDPCETDFTCSPPSATNVYFACNGNGCYQPSATPSFTPDRRPVLWLGMYTGVPDCKDSNPLGQVDFLLEPNWEDFVFILDVMWDAGFRRIVLDRPGGKLPGPPVPQAHYGHLTEDQKEFYDNLADWIANRRDPKRGGDPDFQFGVYIGAWQSGSPCTPCSTGDHGGEYWDCSDDDEDLSFTYNFRFFDPESQSSMQEVYQNVKPWLDLGCDTVWFDNASTWDIDLDMDPLNDTYIGPERLIDLLQSPDYSGVKIGGEAIPRVQDPREPDYLDIDLDYVEYSAWFAELIFVQNHGWLKGGSNPQTVDPETTELGISFHNPTDSPTYDITVMADARDRGFLVWVRRRAAAIKLLQRLYDGENDEFFNALTDKADFDGDGDEDCDDWSLFCTNWQINYMLSPTDPAFYDGDIDNDDDVDCADFCAFAALGTWGTCSSCSTPCSCP